MIEGTRCRKIRRRKDGSFGPVLQVYLEYDPLTGHLVCLQYADDALADTLAALVRAELEIRRKSDLL